MMQKEWRQGFKSDLIHHLHHLHHLSKCLKENISLERDIEKHANIRPSFALTFVWQ